MNPTVKNILTVLGGFLLGSVVNMGLIMVSGSVIPPPEGADMTSMEGLKSSMHLFRPIHFLFPFLAHAFGTFVGAFFVARVATKNKMKFAMIIGILFLLGGISNVIMLPGPFWFGALDIVFAYIPMAYIAGKMAIR